MLNFGGCKPSFSPLGDLSVCGGFKLAKSQPKTGAFLLGFFRGHEMGPNFFRGGAQTLQIYGRFEWFPPKKIVCMVWSLVICTDPLGFLIGFRHLFLTPRNFSSIFFGETVSRPGLFLLAAHPNSDCWRSVDAQLQLGTAKIQREKNIRMVKWFSSLVGFLSSKARWKVFCFFWV